MGRPSKLRKLARQDKTRPSITFYHDVTNVRVRNVGNKYRELFNYKYGDYIGCVETKRDHLRTEIKFPDQETAVHYFSLRKLGFDVKPPQFGHWIDANYWTPLCINPPQQEIKDG